MSDGPAHEGGYTNTAAVSNGTGHPGPRDAVGAEASTAAAAAGAHGTAPTANGGADMGAPEANGHVLPAGAGNGSGRVDHGAGSAVGESGHSASGAAAAASGGSAVGSTERADQQGARPGAGHTPSAIGVAPAEAAGSCEEAGAAARAGAGALAAYRGPGSAGQVPVAEEAGEPTFETVEAFRCVGTSCCLELSVTAHKLGPLG